MQDPANLDDLFSNGQKSSLQTTLWKDGVFLSLFCIGCLHPSLDSLVCRSDVGVPIAFRGELGPTVGAVIRLVSWMIQMIHFLIRVY